MSWFGHCFGNELYHGHSRALIQFMLWLVSRTMSGWSNVLMICCVMNNIAAWHCSCRDLCHGLYRRFEQFMLWAVSCTMSQSRAMFLPFISFVLDYVVDCSSAHVVSCVTDRVIQTRVVRCDLDKVADQGIVAILSRFITFCTIMLPAWF